MPHGTTATMLSAAAVVLQLAWKLARAAAGHRHTPVAAPNPSTRSIELEGAKPNPVVAVDAASARCTICLDGGEEPWPIQRGCCCRGEGGLAHLACMVELAVHRDEQAGNQSGWWACGTCKVVFTGEMRHGLARAWWSRVGARDKADDGRLAAAANLARSHVGQGNYADAAALQVEVWELSRRVNGEGHTRSLTAANNLAATYGRQGKHAEAEELQEQVRAWAAAANWQRLPIAHRTILVTTPPVTHVNGCANTTWCILPDGLGKMVCAFRCWRRGSSQTTCRARSPPPTTSQ